MRLVAVLCWFLAFLAQPAWAASSPSLQSLEQQLAFLAASTPADVGLAAVDLKSGELVSVNGDVPFPMASTVKIAIAANYLAQVEHGRRSLDDRIGGSSARQLMEAMIIRSSNPATDLLLRDLGGPRTVQAWLTQNNLDGLRIDRSIAQLLAARRDLHDVRDSSTPQAMVELLRRIDSGRLLQPSSRSYLLDLMKRCKTGKNRIRGLLPFGTPVENKTGTLNGLTTDVGFITLPDGRRIAVAFFARGGSDRPRSIAEAARAVYFGFASAVRASFTNAMGAPDRTWVLQPQP
ncbi:serine hydrolase [Sphingomonas sp.]|uniref:serine hydrolase n=1 Tax=Sphingomonas sp. TaxID=28214 RepID=UPI001842063C|nr:serine hydrolase [Sphingomonas sp.]MBA3510638.1 serine hydrolase [Sphingomonas sp.]